MLTKILLRIWPALLPWVIYFLWIYVFKKLFLKLKNKMRLKGGEPRIIDMEEVVVNQQNRAENNSEKGNQKQVFQPKISLLNNRHFLIMMYLSLILAIISVISFAF